MTIPTGFDGRLSTRVSAATAATLMLLRAAASLAVPPGFSNQAVVPGITSATTMAFLPDGRMLVGEVIETIWVVQPGASQPDPTPFLQLDSSQLFGEQGLMDILLDPNFAVNQYYYVFYTRGFPGSNNHNRVSRFTASGNGTVPGSELVLWQDDLVAAAEHHGGALAFGPDGKLYITYGEQFVPSDAQVLSTYRGKLLRINLDGTIPTDNPFYDGAGPNKDEIWAYGLRNPFRMSTDPVTGRMYISDVGGNDSLTAFEEVNRVVRGANYGWPLCEGPCAQAGVTGPIYSYPHSGRDACVTGGFVYRATQFPAEYQGSYFFADYVQNWIKRLTFDTNGNVTGVVNFEPIDGSADGPYGDPVKLVAGPDGSLYYVDIGFNDQHVPNDAAIRRISYTPDNQPPVVVASANPTSGLAPLLVSFSSAGSADPEGVPLTYFWTFGDGATSTLANPDHTYAANGSYLAQLTVSDGVNNAVSSNLSINVGNGPTAAILTPSDGTSFRAGQVISYSGSGNDIEDGSLPASAFSWTILFHHDSHIHPGGGPFTNTTTGTLTIPTAGHDFEGSTSYEIQLTVTDSDGLKGTASVTVFPEKVNLSFNTAPAALAIDVDGIRKTAPFVLDDLIGFQHVINAPLQTQDGVNYTLDSWSDGGAASHTIVVPEGAASWLATFRPLSPSHLVAAYRFDEGSGASVGDLSGRGNDGSVVGAAWVAEGKFGSALEFDGNGSMVQVPDSASLDLSSQMTLEAWVYPTQAGSGWQDVIYKANDAFFLEGSSPGAGVPAAGGTFGTEVFAPTPLPVGTWSHLATTYDGATLRLYVNGQEVASHPQTGPIEVSSGDLTIGGDPIFGQYFAGRIDEVQIYDRALSASAIQNNMNAPVGGVDVPTLPLVGAAALGVGLVGAGIAQLKRRRRLR